MLIFIFSQYFFSVFFSIFFALWKNVALPPHCLYRDSFTLRLINKSVFSFHEKNLYKLHYVVVHCMMSIEIKRFFIQMSILFQT